MPRDLKNHLHNKIVPTLAAYLAILGTAVSVFWWITDRPSGEEKELWEALLASDRCDDYRAFMRDNPNSPFITQAQIYVDAARSTEEVTWVPFADEFMVDGSSAEGERDNQRLACDSAKQMAEQHAEEICVASAENNGRNVLVTIADPECSCSDLANISTKRGLRSVWSCSARATASCSGEIRDISIREHCGPAE